MAQVNGDRAAMMADAVDGIARVVDVSPRAQIYRRAPRAVAQGAAGRPYLLHLRYHLRRPPAPCGRTPRLRVSGPRQRADIVGKIGNVFPIVPLLCCGESATGKTTGPMSRGLVTTCQGS